MTDPFDPPKSMDEADKRLAEYLHKQTWHWVHDTEVIEPRRFMAHDDCPGGTNGQIGELSHEIRWSRVYQESGGVYAVVGDADYLTSQWYCNGCDRKLELINPPKIAEWH